MARLCMVFALVVIRNPITMTDLAYMIACYWNLVVPGCKSLGALIVDNCAERINKYKIVRPIDETNVIDNSLAY